MPALPIPSQNSDGSYSFVAAMTVDADGANGFSGSGRAAYGPKGTNPYDYLANAGSPGNWWGIVTDGNGDPVIQKEGDPAPGYYISTTSYQDRDKSKYDPARYVDSEVYAFFVVPSHWRSLIPGVVLGCKAQITHNKTGQTIDAVVGDFGPKGHAGEASMACAEAFGLNPNPKIGGTEKAVFTYTFFPDVPAEGYELQPM